MLGSPRDVSVYLCWLLSWAPEPSSPSSTLWRSVVSDACLFSTISPRSNIACRRKFTTFIAVKKTATTAQYAPATTTVGGSAWKIYEEKQSTRIKINKVSLETQYQNQEGKKRQQKKRTVRPFLIFLEFTLMSGVVKLALSWLTNSWRFHQRKMFLWQTFQIIILHLNTTT